MLAIGDENQRQMEWETVMATISLEAMQWIQDEFDNLHAQVDELEEELSEALEENESLKLQITRLMSDRSLRE